MIMTLQIYSLVVLSIFSGTIYGVDQQQDEKGEADAEFLRAALITGMGELDYLTLLNKARNCSGSQQGCIDVTNPVRVNEKEEGNVKNLMSNNERSKLKTCYEKIRVLTTPDCSPLQSTDFSDMRISDFCIGSSVSFDGSINFRVGMSMPSSLMVNISRAPDDLEEYSPTDEITRATRPIGNDNIVLHLDGCDILARLICSYVSLRWCGCPIREELLILYQTKLIAKKDFLPLEMGFGNFIAHVTLNTPEDTACVHLVFSRKRKTKTNHFGSLRIRST